MISSVADREGEIYEVDVLQRLRPSQEGKTEKQKTLSSGFLACAVWIVARLGGWKAVTAAKQKAHTFVWAF